MRNPKKILLAEDDPDDQEFFNDCIKQRTDFKLLTIVENGEEVLSFLESIKEKNDLPDLIILDQNMPKKNGQQTLQDLKSSTTFEHIPVFIYSTHIDDRIKDESVQLGATLVIQKPGSGKGYQEMLTSMLEAL